jgi:hypothetical protein
MQPESNAPFTGHAVKLPDEVWSSAVDSGRVGWAGVVASVRLLDGTMLEDLIISNRGYILGRVVNGPPAMDGQIDGSMLTYETSEIEGVRIGRRHLWQRPLWLLLNPQHPARSQYHGSHTPPLLHAQKGVPPVRAILMACLFFGVLFALVILAVIGLLHICGRI